MSRSPILRARRFSYLLTGRATCACGARLHGHSSRQYRYYRCSAARGPRCNAPLVNADELEELVWEQVRTVLLNPDLIFAHLEASREGELETISEREHRAISQRLASLYMEERRLYHLYVSGRYDQKKLDDELDRVRTERSGLTSQLREVRARLDAQHEIVERKRSIEEY